MNALKKSPAIEALRLPRLVEADPRAPRLLARLAADRRPLWRGGELAVPAARLTPELAASLRKARGAGHVIRSLEGAETALDAEERGQRMADEVSGVPRGVRISRLLLLSADGAERFYRNVETLLARHGQRVLALQLEADAATLGELLFGSGSMARLVMLEHKDAVAAVLLALVGEDPPEG